MAAFAVQKQQVPQLARQWANQVDEGLSSVQVPDESLKNWTEVTEVSRFSGPRVIRASGI